MAAKPRRRQAIGQRRRVEDEGEEDGGLDAVDLDDDDSISDDSLATDERDDDNDDNDSDTSNIDEPSPVTPTAMVPANGSARSARNRKTAGKTAGKGKATTDTDVMLKGLAGTEHPAPPQEMDFDDLPTSPADEPSAPVIVSSASAPSLDQPVNRRRQEHEDYRKRRDDDPAFVPNRGAFFMHDHRHPGPSANGFRPFNRARGRGGRGGVGGPFSPMNHLRQRSMADHTTTTPWTHDMHEVITNHNPRHDRKRRGLPNGNGIIPKCESNPEPINRALSTEKLIGNLTIRVSLPWSETPKTVPGMLYKQYTRLPDHRPPLRRDRPVRIALPYQRARYILPAEDRSFVFIPRELRPNQQRSRSGMSSVGGWSRTTSIFGGSYYGGSTYSPSVAMSRRSSVVMDREYMFSPTGSVMSRSALPVDMSRPVVRLPPMPSLPANATRATPVHPTQISYAVDMAVQTQALPPTLPDTAVTESRPASIPMHQPRPRKSISVAGIEQPTMHQHYQGPSAHQSSPYAQPFHQQVPMHLANGHHHPETHSRHASYPSHHSTGTPLSQIPERAIHAAPFQPRVYGQPASYYSHTGFRGPHHHHHYPPSHAPQPPPPPPAPSHQHNYYYDPAYANAQTNMTAPMPPSGPPPPPASSSSNLVAQEANGMVYYYDPSQLPAVPNYPAYPPQPAYQQQPPAVPMGNMPAPGPDPYYYPPQQGAGVGYYPQ